MSALQWQVKTFSQLSNDELYDVLKLRIDVFVVEQTCYYPDLDNHDRHPQTLHLFSYCDGKLVAYLRVLPKGLTYDSYVSIGRVAIAKHIRGHGIGHVIMNEALAACQQHFSDLPIKISAQAHLAKFYNQHNFKQVTDEYLEDGIPHIGMTFQPPK